MLEETKTETPINVAGLEKDFNQERRNRIGRDENVTVSFIWNVVFTYNSRKKILFIIDDYTGLPLLTEKRGRGKEVYMNKVYKKRFKTGTTYVASGRLAFKTGGDYAIFTPNNF